MDELKVAFEPYAGAAQRGVVEEIINRRNVRLTGHDDWYPVQLLCSPSQMHFGAASGLSVFGVEPLRVKIRLR